jgi:hypothetical protein
MDIEVDAHIEMKEPQDIHHVVHNAEQNGYKSYTGYGQNLLVVHTENGDIGVTAQNPTFMFGLIVNLKKLEYSELFEDE